MIQPLLSAGRHAQLWRFLLIQGLATLLFLLLLVTLRWSLAFALTGASVFASLLAMGGHDGRWWLLIHAAFLPLVYAGLSLDIHPGWYLLAFLVSGLLFGRGAIEGVPLYLSNRKVLTLLAERLPHGARLLDIGAGSGTVLVWLVRKRPDLVLTGVEQAWLPWLLGRLRLPKSVRWLHGDYRTLDFSGFDATYAFLSPVPMPQLWNKAKAEMRTGSLFLSNTFEVPGQEPDEIMELGDWKGGKLLLWRM